MLGRITNGHQEAPTCVWMDAGLMSYRLCDRNFDCERCPLEAALHGLPQSLTIDASIAGDAGRPRERFPDDRLYGAGHTWLRPPDAQGRVRFGIDSFAASLMPQPLGVRALAAPRWIRRGQFLCGIESAPGLLRLTAPLDAHLVRWNGTLNDDPGALVHSPYDEGWIAELWPLDDDFAPEYVPGSIAARRARLDFRRLLRRVGQLLLLEDVLDESSASNGQVATDIRTIIGREQFLHFLQESLQCAR